MSWLANRQHGDIGDDFWSNSTKPELPLDVCNSNASLEDEVPRRGGLRGSGSPFTLHMAMYLPAVCLIRMWIGSSGKWYAAQTDISPEEKAVLEVSKLVAAMEAKVSEGKGLDEEELLEIKRRLATVAERVLDAAEFDAVPLFSV